MNKKEKLVISYLTQGTEYTLKVTKQKYSNGRTTLLLTNIHTGVLYGKATVNYPPILLELGEVLINSEKEGLLAALVKGGIVSESKKRVSIGCIFVDVVDLLI